MAVKSGGSAGTGIEWEEEISVREQQEAWMDERRAAIEAHKSHTKAMRKQAEAMEEQAAAFRKLRELVELEIQRVRSETASEATADEGQGSPVPERIKRAMQQAEGKKPRKTTSSAGPMTGGKSGGAGDE